ncbi:RNA polymerase-binding transcription factor DksA [Desulfovibrionales bacterium]
MEQRDLEYFSVLLNKLLTDAMQKNEETLESMNNAIEIFADPADRAAMESNRTFTLRLRDRERKLIKKIQGALRRLEEGTYSICDECGENISISRLKARPVTRLCIRCKSKQEEEETLRGD